MNHATTHNKATRRTKAKKTPHPVGFLRKKNATKTGRSRAAKGQAKGCAGNHATTAFLSTSFLPKLELPETPLIFRDNEKAVRDFYKSLTILSSQTPIKSALTIQYGYPYNIAMALSDLRQQLGDKEDNLVLVEHKSRLFFARQEQYNTSQTLFYIPVEPLYLMLKSREHKRGATLLLSVCSYLYKVADIPYHRQENSYLYWMYDRIMEMQREAFEEEGEIDPVITSEHKKVEFVGDRIEQKIRRQENLTWFSRRLSSFKSRSKFETQCFDLAKKYFELYQHYPTTPVYNKIRGVTQKEDEDMHSISWENYISFYAKSTGRLSDELIEMINYDLQEYTYIDEPVIYQPINGRSLKGENFDFEKRLFPLFDELTILLDNYK